MKWALASIALIGALGLAGCSQVSALAPVGGDSLRTVSIATNDLLQEQGITVMVVPVCTESGKTASCSGKTSDGRIISVSGDLHTPITLTVTVGGAQIYTGPAQAIIDKAAQQ